MVSEKQRRQHKTIALRGVLGIWGKNQFPTPSGVMRVNLTVEMLFAVNWSFPSLILQESACPSLTDHHIHWVLLLSPSHPQGTTSV